MKKNYFENLNETLREYFQILSSDIPDFLLDYINTPEMQKQSGISVTCGTCYSKLFNTTLWYSSLDHSVAVALIVWNFTKDKKQTISALLHDIATPVFKHCIDYMNGDYETQESTEDLTTKIIADSKELMRLLDRDGIKLEEVCDYHIYPIADNDTPRLAADRLEYTLSNGMGVRINFWDLNEIKEIYNNIEVQTNEDGLPELGFKDLKIAEKFVHIMSKLSSSYISSQTKYTMELLAIIMKKMSERNLITVNDLYTLSEKEVIEKIENCKYDNISEIFNIWKNATEVHETDTPIEDKYCIELKGKMRYIVPLVKEDNKYIRINELSDNAKQNIERCLNFKTKKYAYLDFNF